MLTTSIIKARNLVKPGRIFTKSTKSVLFGLIALAFLFNGCALVGPPAY